MARPRRGLLGPLQSAVLGLLADADGPLSIRDLAEALDRTHPTGERRIRACVDGLENKGLVAVERRAVLVFEADGPLWWREAKPGETPDHAAGDPVPGRAGDEFTVDVVAEQQVRPVTGSLVSLTPTGRRRALDGP